MNNQRLPVLLAAIGVIDSLYISFSKYGCEACDTVHNTFWGQPFGVPIAYVGILGYLLILLCLVRGKRNYALLLAAGGALVSMNMVLIQIFVLKQYCVFCCISAVIMVGLWLLLGYQQRESRPVRCMLLIPLLAVGAFLLLLHFSDGANQANSRIEESSSIAVSQPGQDTPSSSESFIQDSDTQSEAGMESRGSSEEISDTENLETLPDKNTREERSQTVDEHQADEQVGNDAADAGDAVILTTFYRADGSPVQIDLSREYVLFIASHCEVCNRALGQVDQMPVNERPILIDIWIPGQSNLEMEKARIAEKLQPYSIDPDGVLYDLDRVNPQEKVPRYINR